MPEETPADPPTETPDEPSGEQPLETIEETSGEHLDDASDESSEPRKCYGYVLHTLKEPELAKRFASEYQPKVAATLVPHGGKFLVKSFVKPALLSEPDLVKHEGLDVVQLIEFPTTDDAQAWLASPEYGALAPLRDALASSSTALLAEAVDDCPHEAGGYAFALLTLKVPPEEFREEFASKVDATLVPYDGRFLVRTPRPMMVGGEGGVLGSDEDAVSIDVFVVMAFKSAADAKEWTESELYTELSDAKHRTTTPSLMVLPAAAFPRDLLAERAAVIDALEELGIDFVDKLSNLKMADARAADVTARIAVGTKYDKLQTVSQAARQFHMDRLASIDGAIGRLLAADARDDVADAAVVAGDDDEY